MPTLLPPDVIRWAVRTAATAAAVPGRVLNLLSAAESVVARAEELVRRTEHTITTAEGAIDQVQQVTSAAKQQVSAARPLIQFAEEFSAHEVQAAIKLVDELPRLAKHLNDDVLPILGTLNRVGPDIHELLAVANDVRQAILGIPGFNYLRRRGEERDVEE
ncbi:MAG TPA: hypothetical protein VFV67_01120 [Actinophytocola sp.]|jgi:hypothetical protein|uniref:hypothetical protein n=1 Tax=Actinophytocola sp. TaxID=1872138 RepID=UPI002DB74397|nr:hypothetical protein [Actinophytocola sp.]HEU5469225.1 hypothetical protein [Actinophytocola sp.]